MQTVDIKKSFGRAKDHMIQRSRARIQEQRIQQVCARGLAPYATDVPPFQLSNCRVKSLHTAGVCTCTVQIASQSELKQVRDQTEDRIHKEHERIQGVAKE